MDAKDDERQSGLTEPVTDHGAWEFNLESGETHWSEGIYRIHGVDPKEFAPGLESVKPLVHPDDQPAYSRVFRTAMEQRESFSVKHRIVRPDGAVRTVIVRGSFAPADSSYPDRYIGTTEDVTGRVDYQDRLWHLANRDSLTNLLNRRRFMEELERETSAARRTGKRGAVLIIDVDDFKDINDSLGHPAGDELLARVGQHLRERLRATDTLARVGGDEFAMVLPDCTVDDAREIADGLLAALEGGPSVQIAGRPRWVSASIGIAPFDPKAGGTPEQLLVEADLAMYRAKTSGGGRVEVFDQEMRARLANRLEVEAELREALEQGRLRVHYQPICSLTDGVPIGCEALVRWEHHKHGLLPPGHFIPVAEESGLIGELGERVLEEACHRCREWRLRGWQVTISVNVSPMQLLQNDVVATTTDILERTGLPPELLCLEMTETSLIKDYATVAPALQALQNLGVKIAIDDFGGGSTSLSYLSLLPVDVIKIDRLFVEGLPSSAEDRAIVAAVVSLCEELELTVIAEGIEETQQHWELLELGCRLGQGHLYSRPRPPEELELGGFSSVVQPGVGDPSTIREFMRQIGIPARVG